MRRVITTVVAAVLVASSGIASAQDHDRDRDRDHGGPPPQQERHDQGHDDHDRGGPGPSDHGQQHRYRVSAYRQPHGYAPHAWQHGDRLPPTYRTRTYYVNNYSSYGLYRPPSGQRWVRVDGDAVLVAVTTGVVAATVAGLFYH
jgi:Ni/Co efflux regulator RcnB